MARMTKLCGLMCAVLVALMLGTHASEPIEKSFFDFEVKNAVGEMVSLGDYREKRAILVVNVASACGYTDQNYRELQALYDKYQAHGLEILAFPCNQFGSQEPHAEPEILRFVQDRYRVTFPVFAKVNVNGAEADPLFTYLKTKLTGFVTNDIKWNFTKFLIVNGKPFKRYSTTESPFAMENDIVQALQAEQTPDQPREDL